MVRNHGRKCQKFTWKILEIPTRRELEKSCISMIFQSLPLPYSDSQNFPANRIFQWAKAAPGEKAEMERIVKRPYEHENGPRITEKVSRIKSHG